MDIINESVLVLNKAWTPVHLTTVREAFNDVMSERSRFIDPDSYLLHTMEEWMELPIVSIADDGTETTHRVIHTAKNQIRLPQVMILNDYDQVPDFELRLSTKNIALRDGFSCQYCNKKLQMDEVTLDHIIPQSRGGIDSWTNLVASCFKCNLKKAAKTPKEAGMTLLSVPREPKWFPLTARMGKNSPECWGKFVKNYHKRPSMMH